MSEALRLEALRLASHEFGTKGVDVVTAAAGEYLNFLLGAEEETFDGVEIPTHAPNGDPIVAAFSLSVDAVINLSVALSGALTFAKDNGIPEDNEVSIFAASLIDECRKTLQVYLDGAEV